MTWRIIPLETNDAYMNMAIDEALSKQAAKDKQPIIRFYQWKPSAVSIGYFQSLKDEVDIGACKESDVDIVRRRTGGGAVYHSSEGEVTYSVIGPVSLFPKDIIESYKLICGWVIDGIKELGIESSFEPINDIVADGKKISGNAQTRRKKVLLQHGTILYNVDVEKMFNLLKVPDEKMKDKLIKVVKDRVTCVLDFKDVSRQQTYEALLKGFTKDKDYTIQELTREERDAAMQLAGSRYMKKKWNYMR